MIHADPSSRGANGLQVVSLLRPEWFWRHTWSGRLRSLIVPVAVGGLLAYICRPVVARLERSRVPRGVAIALLLLMFALARSSAVNSVRAVMPSETEALELRVRALYALNQRYQALMGLDRSGREAIGSTSWCTRSGPVDGSCQRAAGPDTRRARSVRRLAAARHRRRRRPDRPAARLRSSERGRRSRCARADRAR